MAEPPKRLAEVPTGLSHFELIKKGSYLTIAESRSSLKEHEAGLTLLGTCLAVFYEAATCNRGCAGGEHILERLCGRMYNLCCAAYILMMNGYYDEANNLVRSMGEIANLVWLAGHDGAAIQGWIKADRKTRLRKFSPFAVRKRLEQLSADVIPAGEDWYEQFCEQYTHLTPHTMPNKYGAENRAHAGGAFQAAGLASVVDGLVSMAGVVGMAAAQSFGFTDLFTQLSDSIDRLPETPNGPQTSTSDV